MASKRRSVHLVSEDTTVQAVRWAYSRRAIAAAAGVTGLVLNRASRMGEVDLASIQSVATWIVSRNLRAISRDIASRQASHKLPPDLH